MDPILKEDAEETNLSHFFIFRSFAELYLTASVIL